MFWFLLQEEALSAFVEPETLDGTNQYFCERCGRKCDAHKVNQSFLVPLLQENCYEENERNYQSFNCHELTVFDRCVQGLKFQTFPYLLTLQLKRFDFDYSTMHRIKLNDRSEIEGFSDFISFNFIISFFSFFLLLFIVSFEICKDDQRTTDRISLYKL